MPAVSHFAPRSLSNPRTFALHLWAFVLPLITLTFWLTGPHSWWAALLWILPIVALVLIGVVNPQSFHWSMQLIVPLELIAGLIAALLVCATGTAAIAGRRATGSSPLRAVHEDW